MTSVAGWTYFAIVQIVSIVFTAIGWILLIPFCVAQAWTVDAISTKDGRPIDRWNWRTLGRIYGNPEDGVSGQTALVWDNGQLVFYLPHSASSWRAYRWSAIRNSCDNLKYVFQWQGGPFRRWEKGAFYFQAGWNSSGLPVLSMGRV